MENNGKSSDSWDSVIPKELQNELSEEVLKELFEFCIPDLPYVQIGVV